ncbi:MAG: CHRD domain-containing protein [Gammaproteobacteria bacterium]
MKNIVLAENKNSNLNKKSIYGEPAMKNLRILSVTLTCVLMLLANSAGAAIINLQSTIDGAQANAGAGTGSSGTGFATMTLDDATNLFSWDISWSGLNGNISVAHFHGPAAAGQNAGVQVNFGAISGLSSPSIGSTTISDTQEADLLAGLWYINIHTDLFSGGEIRGQVQVVPIPAAIWLFGSGLLGLIGISRRKKA